MNHRPPARRATPSSRVFLPRSLLVAIGSLSALHAASETLATSAGEDAGWRADNAFQISLRYDYVGTEAHVRRRDAIVGTTHLRFASQARPITSGLMIEYGLVDKQPDTLLVAGMFTYRMRVWTATASLFYSTSAQRAGGDWRYWGRVRRRINGRHSLGIELFGALETGRPAKWMLGYSATITEALSVSIGAGSGFNAGPDWVARTSLTWRLRPDRPRPYARPDWR